MSIVVFNLGNIIAASAIYGWPMMRDHIIVKIVDFAGWVGPKISNTVMTAECASIRACILTTIAKVANTNPTVPSVKSSYSVLEVHHMRCPVVMPFIGNASDNWPPMIRVVRSVKRRPKRENE